MAGGVAGDIRGSYPKGQDSLVLLEFGPFQIIASKTDYDVDRFTTRFAFKPKFAELTATDIAVTNAITVNIEDDTGTAKAIVTNKAVAAITAGAGLLLPLTIVNKETIINAGAILLMTYISGTSDTGIDVKVRLWVKPVF